MVRSDLRRRRGLFVVLACSCLTVAVALAGSSTGTASATSRKQLGSPRRYQSVLFWLGWGGGSLKTIPWGAVTQVDLFSLSTCARKGRPAADCTGPRSLSTKFNGVSNAGRFVLSVHRHHKLALISIGGSDNPDWYYPCNPSNVAAFARNLVRYMKSNGFDGIDLDIEQDAGTGNPMLTAADLRACTRTVYRDAKAIKTRRGTVPLITSDVDPTTDFDIGRIQKRYVDQFNAMSYGAERQPHWPPRSPRSRSSRGSRPRRSPRGWTSATIPSPSRTARAPPVTRRLITWPEQCSGSARPTPRPTPACRRSPSTCRSAR